MKKLALAPLLLVTACTTAVKPEARGVRVTDDKAASAGCKLLGDVEAHVHPGPYNSEDQNERAVHNRLKNNAADMGANLVIVTWTARRGTGQRGEAFSCPEK